MPISQAKFYFHTLNFDLTCENNQLHVKKCQKLDIHMFLCDFMCHDLFAHVEKAKYI